MRLGSLSIRGVRGIPELDLDLVGRSAVFFGPNGSGKSAIIDAIDFLFSGGIRHLEGPGTGGATLSRHGPHLHVGRDAASVEAEFAVPGGVDSLRLRREFSAPDALVCLGGDMTAAAGVLRTCDRRAYQLTRRHLLGFITAEPKRRADRVQALLDLSEIETLRAASVTAATRATRSKSAADATVTQLEQRVSNQLDLQGYTGGAALAAVNVLRATLQGAPVEELSAAGLKQDLVAPVARDVDPVRVKILAALGQVEHALGDDQLEAAGAALTSLRLAVGAIQEDATARLLARQQRLVLAGIEVLGDDRDCPLCDKEWGDGELLLHLESKRAAGEVAAPLVEAVAEAAGKVDAWLAAFSDHAAVLAEANNAYVSVAERAAFTPLAASLVGLASDLELPENAAFFQADVATGLAEHVGAEAIQDVVSRSIAALRTDAGALQLAWDHLTRLEENLRNLDRARRLAARRAIEADRTLDFRQAVSDSRESVLSGLYEDVQGRFAALYCMVHGEDEAGFSAALTVGEAGLGLKVPFHDQGDHVPAALHSEGHQDSMGLCLFLALVEALEGAPEFIVLDDVLMSIDAGHRKGVCQMLRSEFASSQLIITTHDRGWMEQLVSEGIVRRGDVRRLKRWSLQAGPVVAIPVSVWEEIETALNDEDVPRASQRLRRGMEQFWQEVCEALQGKVPLRMDAQWEFSEVFGAGMKSFKTWIGKARNVAERRKDNEKAQECVAILAAIDEIHEHIGVDRWKVNATTHYNNWENLDPAEFAPIVAAFKRACGLLECEACGGRVALLFARPPGEPRQLSCGCPAKSWPLVVA